MWGSAAEIARTSSRGRVAKAAAKASRTRSRSALAAVDDLQRRRGDHLAVLVIDLQRLKLVHRLLIAEAGDGIGFPGAQSAEQAAVGPVPLIIDEGTDGLQQIGFFASKYSGTNRPWNVTGSHTNSPSSSATGSSSRSPLGA